MEDKKKAEQLKKADEEEKAEQHKKDEEEEKIKAEKLKADEKEKDEKEKDEKEKDAKYENAADLSQEESEEEESHQVDAVDADMSAKQNTQKVIGAVPDVITELINRGVIEERHVEDVIQAELLKRVLEREEMLKAELLKKAQAEDEIQAEQLKAKQADEEAAKQRKREQLQKVQDNANQEKDRITAEEEKRNALVDKGKKEKKEKKEKKGKTDGGDLREWVKGDKQTKRKSELGRLWGARARAARPRRRGGSEGVSRCFCWQDPGLQVRLRVV